MLSKTGGRTTAYGWPPRWPTTPPCPSRRWCCSLWAWSGWCSIGNRWPTSSRRSLKASWARLAANLSPAFSPRRARRGGARDHHWPGHPGHWRHRGLRRTPGGDEPHLGGPTGAKQRGWAGIWAWLRERIFSLALVFALAFLLLVSLAISAALASAAALFHGPEQALLSRLLELVVSLLVLIGVFALLYKYVPDAEIGWQDVWPGGLITAGFFTLGKTAIGLYLGQASVGSAYGAAGSMVVLLVWVYYSTLLMFFGAEFAHAWATRHGGVAPQPHAMLEAAPQTKSEATPDRPPRT